MDTTNLYGHSVIQVLPCDEIEMWHGQSDRYFSKLEEILSNPDDCDNGYFIEVDLRYPDTINKKTKSFPFRPEKKTSPKDKYKDYMKKIKPKIYRKAKKLIGDWTDKKNHLIHYRMFYIYVRLGIKVDKNHELFSCEESNWLEKCTSYNRQRRNEAKNDFEKDFYKLLNNEFFGKTIENVRNRLGFEFIETHENENFINQQSKLTFNGIHKSYENCDSYVFMQNKVLMDKLIYLGLAVLGLSKLPLYETYYDKLQPDFGQENLQLHFVDTDAFVLSVNTNDIIKDSKILEDIFDFSILDENHELLSKKIKK